MAPEYVVGQHLGDSGGGEADVHERQVEEEKYMGMCRRESTLMARRMSRFPRTVARYMVRKSRKRSCCCWGCLESPRRRNSETLDWFASPMWLGA